VIPALLRDGEETELRLTETVNGADVWLKLPRPGTPLTIQSLSRWAAHAGVARITVNGQIAVAFAPPQIHLAGATLVLPQETFLQPTREGEEILQAHVREALGRAKRVVDLFAGCGTFTLALARSATVHAVDLDSGALAALKEASRRTKGLKPVTTEIRDLFKLPLSPREFENFEAVVLDPPRAGALDQARTLAATRLRRLAYVSCNPQTFARDARALSEGGFRIVWVRPVDQFLWASHIELVALLERMI
jgi:23S rRNA (uracil1939-C5)-methyltransferase